MLGVFCEMLWIYTQKMYFACIDLVLFFTIYFTSDALFLTLQSDLYFCIILQCECSEYFM